MSNTQCELLQQENENLRDEIERREREEWERADREYQAKQERRRQQQREYQESLGYANSWEEAFEKGIERLQIEAREEEKDERDWERNPDPQYKPDHYFRNEVKATRRAQSLYFDEMQKLVPVIEELKRKARLRVAELLEKEHPDANVIVSLKDDDFAALVEW